MTRALSRLWFRIRMARFPKAPRNLRNRDGTFRSVREWRVEKMREGVSG